METNNTNDVSKCPFMSGTLKKGSGSGTTNRDWWRNGSARRR